ALLRPDHAAAIPVAAAALCFRPGRRAREVPAFLAASGAMLVLMVWPGMVLNVRSNHARINTALAFYLGNRAGADGHQSTFPGGEELPTDDPAARADHMTGLDLAGVRLAEAAGHGDLDAQAPYWLGLARAAIARDPAGWLGLLGRKTLMFFNGFLITTQKDLYVARDASWILSCLIWPGPLLIPLGVVLPLAAAAVAGRRARGDLFVLLSIPVSCLVTTLVFTHDARFQHAGAMVFVVLAGAGAWSLREAVRDRRWAVPLVAGLVLVAANADLVGTHHVPAAAEYFRMGTMHLEGERPGEASAAFLRSIEADPAYVPSLDNLAAACRKLPACDDEIRVLRRLQGEGRDNFDLSYTVADLLHVAGRIEEAREGARHAIALDTRRHEGYSLLAGIEGTAGDPEAVVAVLREGLKRTDHDLAMSAVLGFTLASLGRLDEAAAELTDALRLHPDDITLLGTLAQVRGAQGRRDEEVALYRRILMLRRLAHSPPDPPRHP
ncbi:MAG: tetratricopeptide repeat protein, partial [Candidatus Polarisedimenticolia bacterium]